jgi:hypothetical protein
LPSYGKNHEVSGVAEIKRSAYAIFSMLSVHFVNYTRNFFHNLTHILT